MINRSPEDRAQSVSSAQDQALAGNEEPMNDHYSMPENFKSNEKARIEKRNELIKELDPSWEKDYHEFFKNCLDKLRMVEGILPDCSERITE